MKISRKTNTQKLVSFSTVKPGECFLYKGKPYVRMADLPEGYGMVNGLELATGKSFYFFVEQVSPIDGIFTFEVKS